MDEFEQQASFFRHAYWRVRAARTSAQLRKAYRVAAKEKARLRGLGYHPEVVRLYGLWLRCPDNEARRQRFEKTFHESGGWPVQLELF